MTLVGILYVLNLWLDGKHRSVSRFFEKRIPSTDVNIWLLDSTKIDSNFRQSESADSPILVILDGIVIEHNAEHPENEKSPIDVTPVGIVIDFKFLQLENA
mgnify:CR=1 FL=1